jgi:hypothetical protein
MRIHSDTLQYSDFHEAAALADCQVQSITSHRSTAREYALEFIIAGHGRHGGAYGGVDYAVGSWDDYGIMLAELFRRDPRAVVGTPGRPTYDGADDFHDSTAWRYMELTPAQAHHNHRRDYSDGRRFYVADNGRRLAPCKGAKGVPCSAYI